MSNLKDRLEEFKNGFESGAPPCNVTPETVAMMHRATAELEVKRWLFQTERSRERGKDWIPWH
jgi:hypothetical protein